MDTADTWDLLLEQEWGGGEGVGIDMAIDRWIFSESRRSPLDWPKGKKYEMEEGSTLFIITWQRKIHRVGLNRPKYEPESELEFFFFF